MKNNQNKNRKHKYSYLTDNTNYSNGAATLGAHYLFVDTPNWLKREHTGWFEAFLMDPHKHPDPKNVWARAWAIKGYVDLLDGDRKKGLDVEVLENLTEQEAKQLIYMFQEEGVRLSLHNGYMEDEEVEDLLLEIRKIRGMTTTYIDYDGPLDGNVTPIFLSSYQVMLQEANDKAEMAAHEMEGLGTADDDENDLDVLRGEHTSYEPMKNIDLFDVAQQIKKKAPQEILSGLECLKAPTAFYCFHENRIDAISTQDMRFLENANIPQIAAGRSAFVIYAMDNAALIPISSSASLREQIKTMAVLEREILQPHLDLDPFHELMKKHLYHFHYSKWQDRAATYDRISQISKPS